jgi:hypothetical protein
MEKNENIWSFVYKRFLRSFPAPGVFCDDDGCWYVLQIYTDTECGLLPLLILAGAGAGSIYIGEDPLPRYIRYIW